MSLPPLVNGKFQKEEQLSLTPMQMGTLLVLDGLSAAMQAAANQLGGFLKLPREADIVIRCGNMLQVEKDKLVGEWKRTVQLATPASLSVIEGSRG